MKCPKCNAEFGDTNQRFCTTCGVKLVPSVPQEQPKPQPVVPQPNIVKPVAEPQQNTVPDSRNTSEPEFDIGKTANEIKNTIKHSVDDISKKYNTKYNLPKQLMPEVVCKCEEEKHVKQYNFMRMSLPIAGYNANGLLQVTNKRIIYKTCGSSIMGNEHTHSEISIDDVAGISIDKSTSLNIPVILAFLLMGFPLTLFGFMLGCLGTLHILLPLVMAGLAAVGTVVLLKTKHYVFFHMLASIASAICVGGILASSFGSLTSYFSSSDSPNGFLIFVVVLIWLFLNVMNVLSYILNLFKNNISIVVTSKSGAATPINCSSDQSWLVGLSLLKPLVYMYETEETPVMEAELGAMISDIQKMGDYGLGKWSEPVR